MPRIPGPQDVPQTQISNRVRVQRVEAGDAGNRLAAAGSAVREIVDLAHDQRVDNELVQAELTTRRRFDDLRVQLEREGPDKHGNEPDLQALWDERSQRILQETTARLTSPRAQRAWTERTASLIDSERSAVGQIARRRAVEGARAGLISSVGEAQTTLTDENATPEARAGALAAIETVVNRAVARRTLAADDGAQMIQSARATSSRFEQERGMRARAQGAEDDIWTRAGGNYETAQELARDIDEPGLRDMVEDRLATRFSRERAADADAIEQAMGQAYAHIEAGGAIESLPAPLRDLITRRGQMDTLRNYARNRAGGVSGEGWTVMTRQSGLVRDRLLGAAADPDRARAFARVDLYAPLSEADAASVGLPAGAVITANLMPDDLNALTLRQRQLRGEAPMGGGTTTLVDQAFNRVIPAARRAAAVAGINVVYGGSGGASDRSQESAAALREQRALFESYIYSEVRAYVQANNRIPTDADVTRIAQGALRESVRSRPGWFDGPDQHVRRFQAAPDNPVRVPFSAIPAWQADRMRAAWAQARPNGPPPTDADIEQAYQIELSNRDAAE